MAEDKEIDNPEYDDDGKPIIEDSEEIEKKDDDSTSEEKESEEGDKEEDSSDKDKDDKDDDEDFEIPTRKSALQNVIARKNQKIKDLKESKDNDDEDDSDEEDFNDDDSIQSEVNKAVQKQLEPILKTIEDSSNKAELDSLIKENPDVQKYQNRIRKYMDHPAYKAVPPVFIYNSLRAKDAEAEGAKKREEADEEAGQSRTAGRPIRKKGSLGKPGVPSEEETNTMTDEEFKKAENEVLGIG